MFSENLKKLRILHGVTQKEMSEYLNISPQSISKWETGDALPSTEFLPMLATFLDCKIDDFFNNTNIDTNNVEDIKTYFNITNKVYNKRGAHSEWVEFCKEFPNVINKVDALCNEIYANSKINVLFIQQKLHCSEEDSLNILENMTKCELLKKDSKNNFYKTVKHAIEGQKILNKVLAKIISDD